MRAPEGFGLAAVLRAAYYRIGVSKRAYGTLDAHLWRLAWKWANFSHPNKPRRWIITRHFGMFNPARQDKWVFGSRQTGFYLRKFAWTKIVRHTMVAGRASPESVGKRAQIVPCRPPRTAQPTTSAI